MPVLLIAQREDTASATFDYWFSTDPSAAPIENRRPLPDLPQRLETAFEDSIAEWWGIGRTIGAEATGELSHAAVCTPNASEMGLMLAWTRLVDECAMAPETTLVVCPDPWLFRHLRTRANVQAMSAPSLIAPTLHRQLRGFVSRTYRVCRLAHAALRLGSQARRYPHGAPGLLVYGHPSSIPGGSDAYFGNLMHEVPDLMRVFHVDAPLEFVQRFAGDKRAVSLHAWGSAWRAVALLFTKWRPSKRLRNSEYGWLIQREAALEGANAQAAIIRWQQICQRRWLAETRPKAVCWPWENHAWERDLTRAAKGSGVMTVGYQHTVVGRHAANHAPASNPDGLDSLPKKIVCNGEAGRHQLTEWGIPAPTLSVAGALRLPAAPSVPYDPNGPVFVALPMKHAVANEMIAAVKKLGDSGYRFLLKVHPMTEIPFEESSFVQRTAAPLQEQAGIRGVLYAASTVGLEALMAGLPTLRFVPASTIAIDILSPPAMATPVSSETLEEALGSLAQVRPVPREQLFDDVDLQRWQHVLSAA